MPIATQCPPADQLRGYVLGTLSDVQIDTVATHVQSCTVCESTVATLDNTRDSLLESLARPAGLDPFDQESDVLRAVQNFKSQAVTAISTSESSETDMHKPAVSGLATPAAGPVAAGFPETIREYRLVRELGRGGMGAVFLAQHTRLKRDVALKILAAELTGDPQALARFNREMEAVGRLEHPNIVRATDAGEHAGIHYLVMEYVPGETLSQIVRRQGPLPLGAACELIRQAAVGLQYVHEHGLVHRDIKPGNLMLSSPSPTGRGQGEGSTSPSPTGRGQGEGPTSPSPPGRGQGEGFHSTFGNPHSPLLKILDLGLARLHAGSESGSELTSAGQMMGTIDYMAPEQWGESHTADIRADLYGLGATLYKLLTGEPPFPDRLFQNRVTKMAAALGSPPEPITTRRSDCPAAVVSLLNRLLAKDAADRPSTPAEVAAAIAPFCKPEELEQLLPGRSTAPLPSRERVAAQPPGEGAEQTAKGERLKQESTLPAAPPSSFRLSPSSFPPNRRRIALLALAASLPFIVFGVWLIVKDKAGNEIARVKLPDDASVAREENGKQTPLVPAADTPQQPTTEPDAATLQAAAKEREVAEWCISRGIWFDVMMLSDNRIVAVPDISKLPKEPFFVRRLDLPEHESIAPGDLRRINALSRLQALNTGGAWFKDEHLAAIDLPKLPNLCVSSSRMTDAAVESLARFRSLESLEFLCANMSLEALSKRAASWPKLYSMPLGHKNLTDGDLAHLAAFADQLTNVTLFGPEVSSQGLAHLARLNNLVYLNVSACRPGALRGVAAVSSLESLLVSPGTLSVAEADAIRKLPKLRALQIGGNLISEPIVDSLAKCQRLDVMTLHLTNSTFPTAETWRAFKRLRGLRHFGLERITNLTAENVRELAAALPTTRIISDFGTFEPTETPAALPEIAAGEPASPSALVMRPATLPGVRSWSLETRIHRGPVLDLAYSPDGKWLATCGQDGTVRLWDAKTRKLTRILLGHEKHAIAGLLVDCQCLAWSPDSQFLATGGGDGTVRLWNSATGQMLRVVKLQKHWIRALGFSPDGKHLAAAGPSAGEGAKRIFILQAGALEVERSMSGDMMGIIEYVVWHPDNSTLVVGASGGSVGPWVWNAQTGELIRELESKNGNASLFSTWNADGSLLLQGAGETIKVRKWPSGEVQQTLTIEGLVRRIRFSRNGETLLVGIYQGDTQLWNTQTWTKEKTFPWPTTGGGGLVDWFPNEEGFVASGNPDQPGCTFSNFSSDKPLDAIPAYSTRYQELAPISWRHDGRQLAVGWGVRFVSSIDLANLQLAPRPHSYAMPRFAWSADDACLAMTRGTDFELFDEKSSQSKSKFAIAGTAYAINFSLSPDSSRVVMLRYDQPAAYLNIADGKQLPDLKTDDDARLFSVAHSSDGRFIAVGGLHKVYIYDADTSEVIRRLEGHKDGIHAIAWSPDDKMLATGGDDAIIRLWDAETGALLDKFTEATQGGVFNLAWSADGRQIASSSFDRALRVWEIESGEVVKKIEEAGIGRVSFANGLFATEEPNNSVRFYDIERSAPLATLVILDAEKHLVINAQGHWTGPKAVQRDVVYVVQSDDGSQSLLTPKEFADKFGWKNDPDQVRLLGAATSSGKTNDVGTPVAPAPAGTRPVAGIPVVRPTVTINAEPPAAVDAGAPLAPLALAMQPAEVKGVESWTVETRLPRGRVVSVKYSPDGRWLACHARDGNVRLLDPATGKVQRIFIAGLTPGELGAASYYGANGLSWSPNSQFLAVTGQQSETQIWDVEQQQIVRRFKTELQSTFCAIAWSPTGNQLAHIGPDGLTIWNPQTGERTLQTPAKWYWFGPIDWSADGRSLAIANIINAEGNTLQIIDAANGAVEREIKLEKRCDSVAWSPDGQSLLVMDGIARVVVMDPIGVIAHSWPLPAGGLNRPGAIVRWAKDGSSAWYVQNGREIIHAVIGEDKPSEIAKARHTLDYTFAFDVSPDEESVATCSVDGVAITITASGKELARISSAADYLHTPQVAFSELEAGMLLVGDDGGTFPLSQWRIDAANRPFKAGEPKGHYCSIDRGGNRLATSTHDAVMFSDMADQEKRHEVQRKPVRTDWALPVWSDDGSLVAFMETGALIVLDANGYAERNRIEHADFGTTPYLVAWSPDNQRLAVVGSDTSGGDPGKRSAVFNSASGERLYDLPWGTAVAWLSNEQVAVGQLKQVKIVEAATGEVSATLPGPSEARMLPNNFCTFISPLHDLGLVAKFGSYASFDNVVRVWDKDYEIVTTVPLGRTAQMSPDGELAAFGLASGVQVTRVLEQRPVGAFLTLGDDRWLVVAPSGHYAGSPRIDKSLVYVVQTDGRQETLTPDEFQQRYGWKNDPDQVKLLGP